MNKPELTIQIDELKLRGISPGKRDRVRKALERELARLLAEEGMPRSIGSGQALAPRARTRVGVRPGTRPDTIGAEVAREIYRGLVKGG